MMVASEAEEAWCPPTFIPSRFSRRWLALWIIHDDSHSAFFSSGQAELSDEGQRILGDLTAKLTSRNYINYSITVEGHTDDNPIHTPQFPSNWELSSARASAVVRFFIEHGIDPQRLRAAGYADVFPKVPNRDSHGNALPQNQAQNRRVIIKLEKIEKKKYFLR